MLKEAALFAIKRMNNKTATVRKFQGSRVDYLVVAALFVVALSYALGYRLDWAQAAAVRSAPAALPLPPGSRIGPVEIGSTPGQSQPKSAVWTVDPKDAAWDRMTDELGHLATAHRGRVAIFLRDLKTNKTWTYHPDDLFPSASLIKVPVMACVFTKIHEGKLALSQKLTLRRHNRVGGSGSIKWRHDGSQLTVRDLLYHMINESDNTATAMLIEALGINYIQQQFPKMGLFYTEIYPEGMSLKAGRVAHENYTTAREMSMLMEKIYRGEMVDRNSSQLMMDILKHKKATASRLAKGLPAGWQIAHKTGLLRQACHDSAIILSPNGEYAITVLTGQNSNYAAAKDFITRLGRVTYRHYRGDNYFANDPKRRNHLALR